MATGLNLGQLFIQLGVDDSKFNRSLSRSTQKLQVFGNKFSGISKMAVVAGAAIAGGVAIIGTSVVKAASDMQELQNVVNVVFDKNTKAINAWAVSTGSDMNRARKDILNFAGTAGASLKALDFGSEAIFDMSKEIVKLSQDASSFRNTKPEQAFTAIQSAIMGISSRPIRQYGGDVTDATLKTYLLSKGITKTVSSLSQQEKVMYRLQLLRKQLNFLEGDAAKTSNKLANSLRGVKASFSDISISIGKTLLPAIENIVNKFDRLLDVLKNINFKEIFNSQAVKSAINLGIGIIAVYSALKLASSSLIILNASLKVFAGLQALINPVALVFIAVGVAVAATIGIMKRLGITGEQVAKSLKKWFSEFLEDVGELAGKVFTGIIKAVKFMASGTIGALKLISPAIDLIANSHIIMINTIIEGISKLLKAISKLGSVEIFGKKIDIPGIDKLESLILKIDNLKMKPIDSKDAFSTWEKQIDMIPERFSLVFPKIVDGFKSVANKTKKMFKDIISSDNMKRIGKGSKDFVSQFSKDVISGFQTIGGGTVSKLKETTGQGLNVTDFLEKNIMGFLKSLSTIKPTKEIPTGELQTTQEGTAIQNVMAGNFQYLNEILGQVGNSLLGFGSSLFSAIPQVNTFMTAMNKTKAAQKKAGTSTSKIGSKMSQLASGLLAVITNSETFSILLEKLQPVLTILEKTILRPLANILIKVLNIFGKILYEIGKALHISSLKRVGKALKDIEPITDADYDGVNTGLNTMSDNLVKVNEQLSNLPTGFKLANKVFTTRTEGQLDFTSSSQSSSKSLSSSDFNKKVQSSNVALSSNDFNNNSKSLNKSSSSNDFNNSSQGSFRDVYINVDGDGNNAEEGVKKAIAEMNIKINGNYVVNSQSVLV